jgi:hypothetical protein
MTSVGVIFMFKKSRCIKFLVFPVQVQTNRLSQLPQSAQPTPSLLKPVGHADSPVANPANLPKKLSNRPNGTSSDVGADLYDWRTPLLAYLRDPSAKVDKSVRRSAFKYVLHNDEPYRRTAKDLLLKCLDSDQARVAMGKVHEGICGTHQSAQKMKWLLRRARFLLAYHDGRLFSLLQGLRRVSKV